MSTPAAFAASRIDVPAGTDTGRPSIVRLTVCVLDAGAVIDRSASLCVQSCVRCRSRERRHEMMRLLLDQSLEIAAELLETRHHRRRARVAENADGLPCHVVGDLQQCIEVLGRAITGGNALQNLGRPCGSFAALRALRAALVREEARRPRDELDEI